MSYNSLTLTRSIGISCKIEIIRLWVLLSTSSTHTQTSVSSPTSPLSVITGLMKCDQYSKKLLCGMVDSTEKHHLFSTQQNPFCYCSLINHGLFTFQKPRQLQTVPFHHFLFRSLSYKQESLCSVPLWITATNMNHGGHSSLSMLLSFSPARKQPHKQTGCFVWTFSVAAISSTKCLLIPKLSKLPCILGTQHW